MYLAEWSHYRSETVNWQMLDSCNITKAFSLISSAEDVDFHFTRLLIR